MHSHWLVTAVLGSLIAAACGDAATDPAFQRTYPTGGAAGDSAGAGGDAGAGGTTDMGAGGSSGTAGTTNAVGGGGTGTGGSIGGTGGSGGILSGAGGSGGIMGGAGGAGGKGGAAGAGGAGGAGGKGGAAGAGGAGGSGGKGGAAGAGGAGGTSGAGGSAGAGGGSAYTACTPITTKATHYVGNDCDKSGCHTPGGGERGLLFGGTVYSGTAGTSALITVVAGGKTYTVCSATTGNFFILGTPLTGITSVSVTNANGTRTMGPTTPLTSCGSCHNSSRRMLAP